MARNFYYGSDSRVALGSKNFAALIATSAESFGLSQQQSEDYQVLDAALQEAYVAAKTPATRTPIAVRQKDIAMKAVQRRAAVLAAVVYGTESVDDSQLTALGLQPRPTRAARPGPATQPSVHIVSVVGRRVKIRIDARNAEGTRLAAGAFAANVYSFVGEEPPTDPRQYDNRGLASRATYELVFPNDVSGGATVWIAAAWVSRRGETSRACEPVPATIQGGPILAAVGSLRGIIKAA